MVIIHITEKANIDFKRKAAINKDLVKEIAMPTQQIIEVFDDSRGRPIHVMACDLLVNEHSIKQGYSKLRILKKIETLDY